MTAIKVCKDCQQEKPLTEFTKNAESKDGLDRYCKSCMRVRREITTARCIERNQQTGVVAIEKHCPSCKQTKPAAEFNHNKRVADGLGAYCRVCANARAAVDVSQRKERNKQQGVTITEKYCSGCQTTKPVADFSRDISGINGLASHCKKCLSISGKADGPDSRKTRILASKKRYAQNNVEKVAKSKLQSDIKHRQSEKYKKTRGNYRSRNRVKIAAYAHRYSVIHREQIAAYAHRYAVTHREQLADKSGRYRAIKYTNGPVEDINRREIYNRDGGVCWLCGEHVDFKRMHLDHKTPIARGGLHIRENVAVSCAFCNQSKGAKIVGPLAYTGDVKLITAAGK